jgi:hypothetical protein
MAERPRNDGRSLKCFICALHFSQVREGLVDLSGDTIAGQFCQTSGNRKMPCSNHHPVVKIDHFNQFQAGPSDGPYQQVSKKRPQPRGYELKPSC